MPQKKFGRFKIQTLLGKGAMGAVYRAHDPMLNRDVAIKIIRFPKDLAPELLTELKKGLLKEAQLAAGLSHPGIVQVYDAGEQKGLPFVVLKLIQGNLLSTLLREKGALDRKQACHIFNEILSGMAYAHEKGIVHLDLKPANIMIGKNQQPGIMDFGIARSVSELREKNIEIAGTPRYMAPEQITGGKLDTRADVFTLGVIFYLMISGKLPFQHRDFDKLRHSITEEPHPPLQSYLGDLPKFYYEFVDKALSKKPIDRFDSAVSMHESFLKCLEADSEAGELSDNGKMSETARSEILNFIMQRMKRKGDFPAVSQYVSEVVNAARSPSSSAQKIAQCVLKDVSLTNRLLRIANSAYYQGLGSPITTISRAVVVLGMEAILNMTSALGIFEHFLKGSNVLELKKQVIEALFTALHAREVASLLDTENSEEPFICGMLTHLGKLIVCFYFNEEQVAIEKLLQQEEMDEDQASRQIMRLSYTELGQAIAHSWKLPKLLQSGLSKMDIEKKGPLKGKAETLQGITTYACELSKASMIINTSKRKVALANIARKFEGKIDIKPKILQKIIDNSIENAAGFSKVLKVSLKEFGLKTKDEKKMERESAKELESAGKDTSTDGTVLLSSSDETIVSLKEGEKDVSSTELEQAKDEARYQVERQEFLMKTITDISMTLTGQFSISDIIMMVLEGMFRGLGMRNVLLAMVTPKRDELIFRFGLGPETEQLRTEFLFPMKSVSEAPITCILKREELVFLDMEKEDQRIPKNIAILLDPISMVFLPVVVHNKAIGLFLAMRSKEQVPITDLELQSVRMLVNQAVLALHQAASKK